MITLATCFLPMLVTVHFKNYSPLDPYLCSSAVSDKYSATLQRLTMLSSSGSSGPRRVTLQQDGACCTNVGDQGGGRTDWVVSKWQ